VEFFGGTLLVVWYPEAPRGVYRDIRAYGGLGDAENGAIRVPRVVFGASGEKVFGSTGAPELSLRRRGK
jgi:hypothetical protein